jgi:hypothetical protein
VATAIISSVSVLVAISAFLVARTAERHSRMPVLVLFPDEYGWCVENVGNGPAVNVVIAQGMGSTASKGLIELRKRAVGRDGMARAESWCNPIHLRPVRSGSKQLVPWPFSTSGVGVSYTDVLGNAYTVRMSEHGTLLTEVRPWRLCRQKRCVPNWAPEEWEQIDHIEAWSVSRQPPDRMHGGQWSIRSSSQ